MVILSMTDDRQVNFKGGDLDPAFFGALTATMSAISSRPRTDHHAMILFSPELRDRGWFDRTDHLRARRPAQR